MTQRRLRYLAPALWTAVAVLLQVTLFSAMGSCGNLVDAVAVAAAAYGLLRGASSGAAVGFAGGLAVDLFGGVLIGLGASAHLLGGALAGWLGRRLSRENLVAAAALAWLAALAGRLFDMVGLVAFGLPLPVAAAMVAELVPGPALTAAVMLALYPPILHSEEAIRAADTGVPGA